MTDQDTSSLARKLMYWLIRVQGLRAGDSIALELLAQAALKYGFEESQRKESLEHALANNWLQQDSADEILLTEQGFGLSFGQ